MKKNRLGITSENVEAICVNTNAGFFYKVVGTCESVCNVTTRNSDRANKNATFIADAFNTANKCGLLPSELLEQNNALISAMKVILSMSEDMGRENCFYGDTEYDSQSAVFGYNLCLGFIKQYIHVTINQIEQQTKTNE